jgi:vacuolar iron transporter family protein
VADQTLSKKEKETLLINLANEQNGVILYSALAEAEKNPNLAEVYKRLAATEKRHVDTFTAKLKAAGVDVPEFRPSWRTSTLIWLAKRFGVKAVLPTVMSMESAASMDYSKEEDAKTKGMIAEEQSHARLIKHISQSTKGGLEGGALAQIEGRHRAAGGNALRAAVLGANDGLVSNLSLVMGVAGASLSGSTILITGLAGLLAGAISMALGEWLSVKSTRELYEAQIAAEKAEIEASPKEEAEELALIYQAKGLDPTQAKMMADQIMSDKENALDTLVREELGIDPTDRGGSAWVAAFTSWSHHFKSRIERHWTFCDRSRNFLIYRKGRFLFRSAHGPIRLGSSCDYLFDRQMDRRQSELSLLLALILLCARFSVDQRSNSIKCDLRKMRYSTEFCFCKIKQLKTCCRQIFIKQIVQLPSFFRINFLKSSKGIEVIQKTVV